jgi:hypothetical protein
MWTKKIVVLTALPLAMALVLAGCETTGQSAGLGAGIGAVAGGIIGAQSGRALEGAAIGAAVGAGIGAIVGTVKKKRLANREQVIQEYKSAGVAVPTDPTVTLDEVIVAPDVVQYGQVVNVDGKYTMLNPAPAAQQAGTIRLFGPDGTELHKGPITLEEGRESFTFPLTTNKELPPGEYKVQVEMKNGASTSSNQKSFVLAA